METFVVSFILDLRLLVIDSSIDETILVHWKGCAELINCSLMLLCICALLTDLLVRPSLLLSLHIGLDILCLLSSTTLY